ncbi:MULTISPECIES: hypothetical protein [Pseudonocardia]|uniref:Uncharacterized protein n=2 Tax=Pseudonocardia TaxID=1847 RepID=A0A1Y2N2Z0_PSEAH|nr:MULTISPECIES: hypothetical protein [Pseudonocardia]OSY41834.1 hypothetical protein BG845_01863 [Pseudonocardia autotrophica]TDN71114.1 hypothetical protein C8E95_0140 [Pseudonocardia autotrophica]GEC26267.1 hypothetical protein PSA01_32960 [Pseudonocardia saturnea]
MKCIRSKRVVGAVIGAALVVASSVALAAPALAQPAPAVNTAANAKSECNTATETAVVPVYVLNRDTAPIDVRATTRFGDHKISKIAPGKAFYHRFETGKGAVPAGTVSIAAYKWENGKGHYATSTVSYAAASCVVNPRLETSVTDTDRDGRINSATVRNVGAHPVDARISGPAGSTAQRLAPGASFTVTDPADLSPVAVFTAYKVVDGTPYFTSVTKRP